MSTSETIEVLIAAGVEPEAIESNPEAVLFCSKLLDRIMEKIAERAVQGLVKKEPLASLLKCPTTSAF